MKEYQGYFHIMQATFDPFVGGQIELQQQRNNRIDTLHRGGISHTILNQEGILRVQLCWIAQADDPSASAQNILWLRRHNEIFEADLFLCRPSWVEMGMLSLIYIYDDLQQIITFYSRRYPKNIDPATIKSPVLQKI